MDQGAEHDARDFDGRIDRHIQRLAADLQRAMIDLARPFGAIALALEAFIDQRTKGRLPGDRKALQCAVRRQRELFVEVRAAAVFAVAEVGRDAAVVGDASDVFATHVPGKQHGVAVFRRRLHGAGGARGDEYRAQFDP